MVSWYGRLSFTMMRTLQLNRGLSSEFPDTVRLDPAETASPFSGDIICTNALTYRKSPGLTKEKDSKRIITNKRLVVELILYENKEKTCFRNLLYACIVNPIISK
jgi:hypothetical protein